MQEHVIEISNSGGIFDRISFETFLPLFFFCVGSHNQRELVAALELTNSCEDKHRKDLEHK